VAPETESRQVQRLKRELESTREYLQSIIEEQEAMNEELRSANEEIQSSNEELQSTNEELETAKEELQSSNEELTTLNEELENRNSELAEVNNDLVNLLASVDIPIVMLDHEMRIRRMNPGAQRTLNLIPNDVGRPIRELRMTLKDNDIEGMVRGVIENLEILETRVQHENGQWYSLRIRPYKTTDNKIDGAVLVLVDVDAKKT
jgi:two-component system CheB/CheR fusion protein